MSAAAMMPRQSGDSMTLTRNYHGVALRNRPDLFVSEALALTCAARCERPHRVVMGADGQFLVVVNADAMRLARAGFEVRA
jgi:hypothetical protein